MKTRSIFLLALLLAGGSAQSSGYYEYIPYYNNDPFKFCTVGVPQDCWVPVAPQLGTFAVTNYYCFNPTSAAQFARVCPRALGTGGGNGGNRGGGQPGGFSPNPRNADPANASP